MTTKTLEQLKQEAEAARVALIEAEEAAKREQEEKERLERKERYEAQQRKERESRVAALNGMRKALTDAGIKFTDNETHLRIAAAGMFYSQPNYVQLGVEQQYARVTTYRREPTNNWIITLDASGRNVRTRRFPPTKSGHSYPKIVDAVKELLTGYKILADREKKAESAKATAERLAAEVRASVKGCTNVVGSYTQDSHDYQHRWHSTEYVAAPGKVFVQVGTLELDVDLAEAVALAVTAAVAKQKERS